MLKIRSQQTCLSSLMPKASTNLLSQCSHILRNIIGQVHILRTIPNLFHWIEFRSIGWQPFNCDSTGESIFQSFRSRPMHHPTIHNQYNSTRMMLQNSGHELFKIIRDNIIIKDIEVQSQTMSKRRDGNRRDDRKSVPSVPTIMDRRLSLGSPSSTYGWLKHKATFIQKNKATTGFSPFFLYVASLDCAKWRLPLRRVRELVVRASGNSSPSVSECATHWRYRNVRRNVCESLRQCGSMSTIRWHSHFCGLLSGANALIFAFAALRAWLFALVDCGPEMLVRHELRRPVAIGLRRQVLLRSGELFGAHHVLVSAARWPSAVAAPVVWLFLLVSYMVLSAMCIPLI